MHDYINDRGDYIDKMLRALLQLRHDQGIREGAELRDLFLFCLYNSQVSFGASDEAAMQKVGDFNSLFLDPMNEEEIEASLSSSRKKRYRLKNATIIEKLGITPEEQDLIGFYAAGHYPGTREAERQEARNRKAARDAKICELFDQGMKKKQIAEEVGCAPPTVGNVLRRLGRR